MKKYYTTILFDFFGTLVAYTPGDYFRNQRKKTYLFLVQNGFMLSYEEWEKEFKDHYSSISDTVKLTLDEAHMHEIMLGPIKNHMGKKIDKLFLTKLTEIYLDEWSRDVYKIPHITSLLKYLSKRYTLGIVSNTHSPELVHTILQKFAMDTYFTEIITSIDHGKRKPHKSIFDYALQKVNAPKSVILFVGDNYDEDYLGATNYGIDAMLIDPGVKYPTLGTNRINELKDLKKVL